MKKHELAGIKQRLHWFDYPPSFKKGAAERSEAIGAVKPPHRLLAQLQVYFWPPAYLHGFFFPKWDRKSCQLLCVLIIQRLLLEFSASLSLHLMHHSAERRHVWAGMKDESRVAPLAVRSGTRPAWRLFVHLVGDESRYCLRCNL